MTRKRSSGLHGRVIHDLGQRIVSGQFEPGAALPSQEECCAILGVSRSVLREALRVLAAKGLVEARPKAGTFVRPREAWCFLDSDVLRWRLETAESDKVMDQLYELRQMVEPVAASLAASRAKLTDFQTMGKAYEDMVAATKEENIAEPDLKFHRAIIAASGNELFASLGKVVEAALTVCFSIGAGNPEGPQHSLEMHKTILDAIVDRDGPAARLAMQKLIAYSKQTVLQIREKRSANASVPKRKRHRSA